MKKITTPKFLTLALAVLLSVIAFAKTEKVIQIFRGGEIIQTYNASEIDYIEVNDLVETPTNVKAEMSDDAITITWDAVPGATYTVLRSPDNETFTQIASRLNTNSYTDKTPLEGANYYRIKAVVNSHESETAEVKIVAPTRAEKENGIYLGLTGFNQQLYKNPISMLRESAVADHNAFISGLSKKNGTLLYYSVDNAINTLQSAQLPEDLSTVAIVTFTDGVDEGSGMMPEYLSYDNDNEILDAVSKRVSESKVKDLPISSYTIGFNYNVSPAQKELFKNNLAKLSYNPNNPGSNDYAYEAASMNEVNAKFREIAEQLTQSNYVQNVDLNVPGLSNGAIVRFTFDNVNKGENSKLYIQGRFNKSTLTLEDVQYVGMTSTSGTTVQGTLNKNIFVDFTFENIRTETDVQIKKEFTDEWEFLSTDSSWIKKVEFDKDNDCNVETKRSSAAIMLVLDCSSSLTDADFETVKSSAKEFINTLYRAYNEGGAPGGGNDPIVSGKDVETITVNGVSFDMIRVEGGSYMMGSNDGYSDEKPVHQESVSTFYIGKTEVTQALWQAVMGSNPSYFSGTNLPVEQVSWNDCQTFITKLNQLTGKNFRLPSEPEWEYAARGGNKSQGYTYSGSNTISNVAWYSGNSSSKTHTVATKAPNELGIYDMSGNVWEWTSDLYSSDYNSPRNSASRVNRGGGWNDFATNCRVANRYGGDPSGSSGDLGLRLAL